ncbi:hypothetical protein C8J57DRAFT_1541505 [Mycena rebaudengoi]|nr:hypothetical protein C8J57DRAFT_1541505 [Mycena rebaudengoi]
METGSCHFPECKFYGSLVVHMRHDHAKSYSVTCGVKTFDVPREDNGTLKCPWQEGDGSECQHTCTNSEPLRKHLKNKHKVKSQIRIQSNGIPQVPVGAYSNDANDDYSDGDEDPPRSPLLRSSVMPPLGGGSASGTTRPFVGSAIPQTEEGIVGSAISQTEEGICERNRYHAGYGCK